MTADHPRQVELEDEFIPELNGVTPPSGVIISTVPRWTWRVALRIWFSNHVKRHLWNTFQAKRWNLRLAPIDRDTWEWAQETLAYYRARDGGPTQPSNAGNSGTKS